MSAGRYFIDTAFVQALYNHADAMHASARAWANRIDAASELWTTEAILVEVGNALSSVHRGAALAFIDHAYRAANVKVVSVDSTLLRRAIELYRQRQDKQWGMTDCISFLVMRDENLTEALTADKHFSQAGFVPLMLGNPSNP